MIKSIKLGNIILVCSLAGLMSCKTTQETSDSLLEDIAREDNTSFVMGVDTKGGFVVRDPITGEIVQPCKRIEKQSVQQGESRTQYGTRKECKTIIVEKDGELLLTDAKGKVIESAIYTRIDVFTFPKNSHCGTVHSSGNQHEGCWPW